MHLAIALRQKQSQELTVTGDLVLSLFGRTVELLRDADFQRALEFVAARKKMERYNDMVDFLFCELVLGYRERCFRFYRGEAPPLRDSPRATPEQIEDWDIFLAAALHVAHQAFEQKRRLSWTTFREFTKEALRQAS